MEHEAQFCWSGFESAGPITGDGGFGCGGRCSRSSSAGLYWVVLERDLYRVLLGCGLRQGAAQFVRFFIEGAVEEPLTFMSSPLGLITSSTSILTSEPLTVVVLAFMPNML
jgi:hypothetical protein